jgi:hypothetical protein
MLYTNAGAQSEPFREKPRKVKMPRYFIAELPSKTLPFSAIHVIQTVWDSTTLGYIQKGAFNIPAEAIPAKDMTAFLQEYVTSQYKEYFKKDGKQVLMIFKNLRMTEKTFFSNERAYLLFNADAYISADGNNYKLAASVDSVLIMQGMTDVTALHGENLAYSILDLLKVCLRNGMQTLNNETPGLTPDQIKQKEMGRYDWPIIKTEKIMEGTFMTFEEFLQNTPSVSRFETEIIDKKKLKILAVKEDSSRIEIKPWGICKEGEMYKFYEGNLIPIEKKGNGFIISDYLEKSQRRNSGIAFGALFGGLTGVAIASATSPKLFPVTLFSYIKKQQPDASAIDMKTGELTF